jgi:formate/nitrite transporter FocA (FNT family)
MEALYYVLGYLFIGCIASGISTAIANKEKWDGVDDPFLQYLLIPLLWPLGVIMLICMGTQKLTHYILYSKQEKVDKMVKRLTQ